MDAAGHRHVEDLYSQVRRIALRDPERRLVLLAEGPLRPVLFHRLKNGLQTPARHRGTGTNTRYGGYCAYAVSKGKLVTVDPDVYVVLDEKLFLFSNADARAAFENEEPGVVQVADGKWAELESERAQKKGCFSCF